MEARIVAAHTGSTSATAPAIDSPGVRAALRRRRALAASLVVVALAAMAAVGIVGDDMERREAARTEHVVGLVVDTSGPSPTHGDVAIVRYRFDGTTLVEHVDVDGLVPQPEVGDRVRLVLDPHDPSNVALEGWTNDPPWALPIIFAALITAVWCIAKSIRTLYRAHVMRTLAAGAPWRQVEAERFLERVGFSSRGFTVPTNVAAVRFHEGERTSVLVVGWAPWWTRRARMSKDRTTVEVVGDPGRRALVRSGGSVMLAGRSMLQRFGDVPTL